MMRHSSSRRLAPSGSESEVTSTIGKALLHLRVWKLPMAPGVSSRAAASRNERFSRGVEFLDRIFSRGCS